MRIADGEHHHVRVEITTKDGQRFVHNNFIRDNDLMLWNGATGGIGRNRFRFKLRLTTDPLPEDNE